jgi:hypothetical protein
MAGTQISRGTRAITEGPPTDFQHEPREGGKMLRGTDRHADPVAATASLAAEAALLEGRLRQLREAIHTVDARIESISETLRKLRHTASGTDYGESRSGDSDDAGPGHAATRHH